MGWKDVEFSGSDSAARVQRLQALCAASPKEPGFDGLLIIGGVDSYHSKLSQAVLKYILLGSSGQELLGEQVLSEENDRLEEVVVLLTRHRISIFHSSESDAAVKILPMVAQWRNVSAYTFHDSMDPDEQEARKIHAFKAMVNHVKRIGIPYGVDSRGKDLQDTMIPEKWPLVQSYGLEDGANGKGFFTMNHQIVNVSSLIRQELSTLDDFTAKRVATQVAPLLTHHYNQFLMKLDHAETPAARNAKSEVDMGEDLLSFYDFGTTQHEARGLTLPDHRGSRVLFGKRTALASTAKSSTMALLKNSGVAADKPATHMLVQSEDPFSGVRFTRTYFLATGTLATRVVDEDALVHEQAEASAKGDEDKRGDDNGVDTRLLIALYVAMLRGFRAAVKTLTKEAGTGTKSIAQCLAIAKQDAMRELTRAMETQPVLGRAKLPPNYISDNLEVRAENVDACGQEIDSLGQQWSLVYVSMELKHVPSQCITNASLGSLAVGDTVLFRSVPGAPSLNTTESFPYFRSWVQDGVEARSVQAQLRALQSDFMLQSPALQLGRPITPLDAAFDDASSGDTTAEPATSIAPSGAPPSQSSIGLSRARLLLECEELPLLDGSMQLFTNGFCFKTPHMIPILVSFAKHVASFRIMSTAFEELVLLQLELKDSEPVSFAVPFALHTARTIAFPLLAGTRFQEEIVRALSSWKSAAESLGIPFYRPHDLTQYDGLTPRDERLAHADEVPPIMVKTCAGLVRKPSSIDGASGKIIETLFPRWFIPKDANPSTTLPKPKKGDRTKTIVPITVVLGLPGSSAGSIAATVTNVSSAAYAWELVDVDCRDERDAALASQLDKRIGTALQRTLSATASDLPPRLLVCIVGYVDAQAVAASIKSAASNWPMQTKIASVIGCVSATNTYLPDPLGSQSPLPKLFDQLTSGFATHVVVTHSSDVPSSTMGRLRYHIDQVNPFADIHVLSSDVFEGSMTPLLSVDRFESVYYKNYRDVHFPQWERATQDASDGIDPALMPQCLRFEIAAGMEKTRFLYSIGKTLTPYAVSTKSIDKIHPMDTQMMAKQPAVKGGIRLAQSIATEKVLVQTRQSQQELQEQYGDCWCIEAVVSFAGDADTVYEYVSTGFYMRMRVVGQTGATVKPLEIKITGRQLQAAKIHDLIVGCFVKMDGAVQPLRSKVNLTMKEKRELQKLHVMDDLPDGFYYDGISYIDEFGGRHEFHPRMNEIMEDHVRKLNEATHSHNAKVEENRKSQQTLVRQIGASTCA